MDWTDIPSIYGFGFLPADLDLDIIIRAQRCHAPPQIDNLEKATNMIFRSLKVSHQLCSQAQEDYNHESRITKDNIPLTLGEVIETSLKKPQGLGVVESCRATELDLVRRPIHKSPERKHHCMETADVADHVREPTSLRRVDMETDLVWIHASDIEIDDYRVRQ